MSIKLLGQVTTRDGHLAIVVENQETHGLQFKSGMLQSWNKFCFTTGYIEGLIVCVLVLLSLNLASSQSVLCSLAQLMYRDM